MSLFKKKERLTVQDMLRLEKALSNSALSKIGYAQSIDDVAGKLHLRIEFVPDSALPSDTEAELTAIDDTKFKGLIRIKESEAGNGFPCFHEIMHFVFDVGVDNRVEQSYARKAKGKTPDKHEQEINYLTAAYSMPRAEIAKRIKEYDESSPKMDEMKFVSDMAKKYRRSSKSVIRRIQEVRSLSEEYIS